MNDTDTATAESKFIDIQPSTMVQVALLGVMLGAVSWVLTLLADRFLLTPMTCSSESTTGICLNSEVIAGNGVLVIMAIIGVLGLVRLGVYRPMLVALAATISLWGVTGWIDGLAWYEGLTWMAALYALTYTVFTWLARPRMFLIAIILTLLVIVGVRLLPEL